MAVILYLETNFLLSLATGRDPEARDILSRVEGAAGSVPVRLAIPTISFMEAHSSFHVEVRERRKLQRTLREEVDQLKRNHVSSKARSTLTHLQQAVIEIDGLVNQMEVQFLHAVLRLASNADLIQLSQEMIFRSMTRLYVDAGADNLIANCVIEHAREQTDHEKAFLSGNTRDFKVPRVLEPFQEVGITKSFSKAIDFLSWLDSRPFQVDA